MARRSFTLLSLFLSYTLADDSDLVGCKAVSCPTEGAEDRCTVAQNSFLGIGYAPIPDVPSSLDGLSLVKGVNLTVGDGEYTDNEREFKSVYYLGTPSDLEVTDLAGCAVIFNSPPAKKFQYPKMLAGPRNDDGEARNITDTPAASGTCSEVIDQRCIDRITERARNVVGGADGAPCTTLEDALQNSSLDECSDSWHGASLLGNLTVKSLADLSTISGSQNSSSDCWPVVSKSDNLSAIAENTAYGNNTATAYTEQVYKITPVLTVFSGNGDNNLVDETTSQMTCLKIIKNRSGEDVPDNNDSSAFQFKPRLLDASLVTLVSVLFAWL